MQVIQVDVITGARQEKIEQLSDKTYKIKICQQPENNKANKRLIKLLAKYFDKSKKAINIVKGSKNKKKLIEIW